PGEMVSTPLIAPPPGQTLRSSSGAVTGAPGYGPERGGHERKGRTHTMEVPSVMFPPPEQGQSPTTGSGVAKAWSPGVRQHRSAEVSRCASQKYVFLPLYCSYTPDTSTSRRAYAWWYSDS